MNPGGTAEPGTGPFGSDAALDWLGDLAEVAGATRSDTGELDPASVSKGAVFEEMRQVLAAVGETGAPGEQHDEAIPYATAGLVAARLTGQSLANTGTRLLGGLADESGSENLGLIDRASAELLRDQATSAVTALRADQPWLDTWTSGADVVMQLERLAADLAPGLPAASLTDRGPEQQLLTFTVSRAHAASADGGLPHWMGVAALRCVEEDWHAR